MGGGVFCLCGCGYEEVIPDGYVPVAIPSGRAVDDDKINLPPLRLL
jgi:hypothetical protein